MVFHKRLLNSYIHCIYYIVKPTKDISFLSSGEQNEEQVHALGLLKSGP